MSGGAALQEHHALAGVFHDAGKALAAALERAAAITGHGRRIDEHQIVTRRLARLATHEQAAKALAAYERMLDERGELEPSFRVLSTLGVAGFVRDVRNTLAECEFDLGLDRRWAAKLEEASPALSRALSEERYRKVGQALLEDGAANDRRIPTDTGDDADETELRAATRRFAQTVVAPEAEAIHREDLLIPEHIITQMAELGYFGMSVPEAYGGVGMSNLMMVIATEELSVASLPAAGSLITRPEILTKALLKGGTEAQKEKWLPPIAAGEIMVAISVTEPNIGSDVASLTCRADETTADGRPGYALNGAKAWCTFAGRADVLGLLARTEPDAALGHKGLSLFIVEKDAFPGHEFEMAQPGGGTLTGKADATLGYRGMHSFTLQFEDYFVPAENLVGEDGGRGKGFYLQMDGFAAGRLQTGGRAVGLAQAALETAVTYAKERPQFGKPIAAFQNTQYEIGWMATELEAARQLTYAAARAMDRGDANATLLAAMAKFYASRAAVDITQRAQLLHGGWGYAEEYPISRYVADALVLPIFEGVEPILELKVIGRGILAAG